jgi:hypothetical protein
MVGAACAAAIQSRDGTDHSAVPGLAVVRADRDGLHGVAAGRLVGGGDSQRDLAPAQRPLHRAVVDRVGVRGDWGSCGQPGVPRRLLGSCTALRADGARAPELGPAGVLRRFPACRGRHGRGHHCCGARSSAASGGSATGRSAFARTWPRRMLTPSRPRQLSPRAGPDVRKHGARGFEPHCDPAWLSVSAPSAVVTVPAAMRARCGRDHDGCPWSRLQVRN